MPLSPASVLTNDWQIVEVSEVRRARNSLQAVEIEVSGGLLPFFNSSD
jgi:hypothetical protein